VQIGAGHGGGGGNHRGPVTLHSVDCEVSSRTAPKARRRPPLAALPARPVPAHAVASADCQRGSSAPEPCEASPIPQPVRTVRRPCARASAPARLAAAHV
jgi:hypothetical protein